ncbi:beta-ketoacyl-[acyl-carrier-protein] synthase family protein [Lentibacillus sp. N15]|uniref:beta-ketoacyl-[acyl-carrier-protein] synthase family protein n=1 Tax=Lentibacillus songyuanensis TaxID=3136161 RepID=UPI0031BB5EA7
MNRVAITGIGVVSPLGIGKDQFWSALTNGNSKGKSLKDVKSSSLFRHRHKFGSQVIMEVEDFKLENINIPSDIYDLDRYIQFAILASELAKEDAKLTNKSHELNLDRLGVSLSTAICGTKHMEEEFLKVTNNGEEPIDPMKVSPSLYLSSMSNTPSTIIASLIGAEGPCVTLSTGCIGGIDAIGYAYEQIKSGETDIMIAGASEAPITPITVGSFDIINCLSTQYNDEPRKASRPYDGKRDGFVLSEGSGVLILEEWTHAIERNTHIYGEITGFSNTSNALHMTDLVSEGEDLTRAINLVLKEANLNPHDIDYINGHGSSTPQNDKCETSAIKSAFGEYAKSIPINSTKSLEGHPLSAASALEIIASVLSFENGSIHATLNHEYQDEHCDLDYVPNESRDWDGDRILSIASGFSGLHSAMILERPRGRG